MKKSKLTKLWKFSLALFISLASIGTLINSMDLLASEEFDVNETITMNEDNTQATITLDTSKIDEKYTIQSIQNPDGSIMDIENNPSYIVDENGKYTFIVNYKDTTSEEEEELTYNKEVEVTQIGMEEEKEETQTTDKVETKQPRTITNPSGDSLTVEFEKDNTANIDWSNVSQVDWNFYNTEKVEITAIFSGKGNSKTREIEVDVPDGYKIIGYSAIDGTTSQNGESILTTTEEVQQALESSTLTSQNGGAFGSEKITGYKSKDNTEYNESKKSGKIKYTFNSEADTIILTLQLEIDTKLYNYSDTRESFGDVLGSISIGTSGGQLLDNLKVKQTSGSEILEETVKANVKGTIDSMYLHALGRQSSIYIDDDGYSPSFRAFGGLAYYNNAVNSFDMLIDELVITYNYPVGTEFIGIEGETTFTEATNMSYANDPISRTLTITYTKFNITGGVDSIAKPLFKLDGNIYGTESGKQSSATFKSVMATKVFNNDNYYIVNNSFAVSVIDKDIPMELVGYNQIVYDYTLNEYDDGYQFLGNHYATNPSYVDKKDINLEWTFDSSLGIRIARLAIPTGSTISNIKVYTTSNPTGYTLGDMKSTTFVYGIGSIIDAEKIGLADGEYITKIAGKIDNCSSQYYSGSPWATKTNGYAAYGNIQNGSGGSHTLTIDGVSSTSTITTTTNRVIDAAPVSTNALSSTYYPGSTIPVNTIFSSNVNTYNRGKKVTDDFLQDPNIYIRVPEGFSLDETSVKLIFGTVDVTSKATLANKTTNPDGTVIYKYSFNEDYTVMAGVQSKNGTGAYNTNTQLKVNFNLKVSVNNQGTAAIPLRDIIMVEGKGVFVGYDGSENYIRNDDFGVTSTGNNLMAPNTVQKITVVKLPELQISSGIRVKDSGNDYSTYDGTDSSVVGLSRTKNAEIEISYFNNAPNTFSDASIYFPIPKEGKDYGKYFNNKALTDAINNPDSSPFTWSADLTGEILVPGFTTYYAIDGNVNSSVNDGSLSWEAFIPSSNWKTYSEVSSDLDKVVFVKFVANSAIGSGDSGSFTFELEVAADSPVDEISYWRTYSSALASGASTQSWVVGSVLAASPSIGEISGLVFYDNNANGKFDAGDAIYTGGNITVNLTEKDGKISTTTLTVASDGTYSIEQLKEGEYSISAINSDNTNYHFSKTTASTSSVTGSNVTANTNHTEGKYEGMVIKAGDSETYENVGIGLISKIDTSYEFEDRVMSDISLDGKVRMVVSGNQIEYNGTLINNTFPQETFSVTPNVALPEGMTFVGWQLYTVNGSGTATKLGDVISNAELKDKAVPTVANGERLLVKAIVSYGPTINAPEITKYVGDSVDLMSGVTATNEIGTPIALVTGMLGNTEVTQSIPVTDDNKYKTAGTYEVTYKVTDIATNSSGTVKRLVKVHEAPTVSASSQEYTLGDTGIMTSVLNNPSATWQEAPATVGDADERTIVGPADTTGGVNKIKAEIIGPSTDFSKAGLYFVTYTATDANSKTGSKTVSVLIKSNNAKQDDTSTLTIDAKGFTVENADAKDLTETIVKNGGHAGVGAYQKTVDGENNVTGYTDITSDVTIKASQLRAIQDAPIGGGIYDLTFTVTKDSKTVSTTVKVVVKGTSTPTPKPTPDGDSLAITASGFTLDNADAKGLDSTTAITKGKASAALVEAGTSITNISVDATQLAAIKNTNQAGGIYDLTYTAEDQGVTISTTVKVVVKGITTPDPKPTPDGDSLAITANGFTLENADAKSLSDTTAKTSSNVAAYLVGAKTSVTDISVDATQLAAIKAAPATGGFYDLTFTAKDQDVTTSTTVKVVVKGTTTPTPVPTPDGDELAITAEGFTLERAEALVLNNATAITKGSASATLVESGKAITDISVDATQLAAIKAAPAGGGIYNLTYTAKDQDVTISTTVKVVVKGTNTPDPTPTPDGDTLAISANGFTLENADAKSLNDTTAITSSGISAILVKAGTSVTDIEVKASDVTAIKAVPASGGVYDLTFTAKDQGEEVSTTVKVVVKGTSTPKPKPTPDGDSLAISAQGFTITNMQAKVLTDGSAITNGNASAWLVNAGTSVTGITVDQTQLTAIHNVGVSGGIYNLSYSVTNQGVTTSTTVKVVVKGVTTPEPEPTPDGDTLAITATGFTLENAAAVNLDATAAISNGKASAYLVKAGTNITDLSVDATQLAAIKAASKEGGIFDLTYTSTSQGKTISTTVKVVVKGTTTPEPKPTPDGDTLAITAKGFILENSEAARLDNATSKTKGQVAAWLVNAKTAITDITAKSTDITKINGAPKSGGIYDLVYTAKEQDVEITSTVKVVVKGTSTPEPVPTPDGDKLAITAKGFTLENNEASSLSDATAITRSQAQAFLVTTGTSVNDITVDATQLTAIQNANKGGGVYDLTFTAEDQGTTISTTVKVVVKGINTPEPKPTPDGDTLAITAKGFTIENAEASTLSDSDAITKSSVVAYLVDAKISVSNISVKDSELAAIKTAPTSGGVYDLTYTAEDQGVKISTTVKVVVKGTSTPDPVPTPDGDTLAISAKGFTIENTEASKLTSSSAITNAETQAWLVKAGVNVTDIRVDATQLEAIQKVNEGGGIFDLTITAKDQGVEVSTTIKVVVKGINTPTPEPTPDGDTLAITAEGFTIENTDATTLNDSDAITKSNVVAYLVEAKTSITDITVDSDELTAINNVGQNGGIYVLTFTAKEQDVEISTTVKVVVKGTTTPEPKPTPDGDELAISAEGFTLENKDAASLTSDLAITNANAMATLVKAGKEVSVSVDTAQLEAIQKAPVTGGIYELTYTAENQGVSISTTIKVVVKGTTTPDPKPTPDGDELAISAKGYTLENADATALSEADAITKGNVQASLVKAGTAITNIKVDATQLATINSVGTAGGIYDLTYTAEDQGVEISTTVKVVVKGTTTPDPKPTPDGDELTISAEGFELDYADASLLTDKKAISEASAEAWLIKANSKVTNISVDQEQLKAIQSASKAGGVFELTFTAEDQGVSISTTVKVFVRPANGITSNNVTIDASGYIVSYEEAIALPEADSITKGKAIAYEVIKDATGKIVDVKTIDVSIDSKQLDAIHYTSTDGGLFDFTYSATNGTDTANITVKVLVKPKYSVADEDTNVILGAEGFTLENSEAASLDATKAKASTNGNAQAYKVSYADGIVSGFTNISDKITVNKDDLKAIQEAPVTGGVYDLEFTVEDDGVTVTKTVKVIVLGTNTPPSVELPDGDELAISANDFTIENTVAATLDDVASIANANAQAWKVKEGLSIEVKVDETQLEAIKKAPATGGEYDLTFYAVYNSNARMEYRIETTIKVTVLPVGEKPSTAPTTPTSSVEPAGSGTNTGDTTNVMFYLSLLLLSSVYFVGKNRKNKA